MLYKAYALNSPWLNTMNADVLLMLCYAGTKTFLQMVTPFCVSDFWNTQHMSGEENLRIKWHVLKGEPYQWLRSILCTIYWPEPSHMAQTQVVWSPYF